MDSSTSTTGSSPFLVMVLAHSKVVSSVFKSVPLQWFSRIPPAALNGVIFAVIWRIVNQHDFKIIFVSKFGQAFHKPGSMAGILRPIIQVDNQLLEKMIPVFIALPPVLNAINNKITGFKQDPKDNREQPWYHIQNTQGNQFGLVPQIMVVGLHGLFATRRTAAWGIA